MQGSELQDLVLQKSFILFRFAEFAHEMLVGVGSNDQGYLNLAT